MGRPTGARVTIAGRVAVELARDDADASPLPGGQVRVALAVLVLERHRVISRHELADRLWPDRLPASWESAVRNVVTRLRQALAAVGLDDVVRSTADGYQIVLPAGGVVDIEEAGEDVVEAERLLAQGDVAAASTRARRAAATLARPVLPGIDGQWADVVREQCGDLRVRATEVSAAAALSEGNAVGALASASDAVELAPFRESAHRLLMRAHAAGGNRAEALRAYGRCRRLLGEELGINPSTETEQAYLELLFDDDAAPAESGAPATGSAGRGPSPSPNELIGREHELRELDAAFRAAEVVTISGPGGVGKTRLAAAFAEREGNSERTVFWADLAPLDDSSVVAAIGGAVGGGAVGVDPLDAAVNVLDGSRALVVLDNCEHVIDAAADVVRTLHGRCRGVRILATSRAPLGIGGERVVRLGPLALPDAADDRVSVERSPAVLLFARRAAEVRSDFKVGSSTTGVVAEICRRLDGLPLALELAASQVRVMPVADIANRLDDRFRLLQSHRRDVDPRHRSLAAVIEWSYDLLPSEERVLFDRLSVFPASMSVSGAHEVAARHGDELDTLALLGRLVDQSMIVPTDDDEARFSLLESMREYGRSRLEANEDLGSTRHRFVDFTTALAERAGTEIRGPDEALWVRRLDAELPNIVGAFRWAAEDRNVDFCLRITTALFDYAFHRIRPEVGVLAADAVALPGADRHPLFGRAAAVAGYLAWQHGLMREANDHLAVALQAEESWVGYDGLGTVRVFQGDVEEAIDAYARAARFAQGDPYLLAITHSQQAFAAIYGDRSDAADFAALAEAEAVVSGNPTALAQAAWATGLTLFDHDPELALRRLERCIELSVSVGNRLARGAASVPAQQLRTKLERRSSEDDLRAAVAEIEYMHRTGNTTTQGVVLRRLVWALAATGRSDEAVVIAGAEAQASVNLPMRVREGRRHQSTLNALRDRVGAERYERLWARGGRLSADELYAAVLAAKAYVDDEPS